MTTFLVVAAAFPDGLGKVAEHSLGGLEVDAAVSDGDTRLQVGSALTVALLVALVDVTLDHDTNELLVALRDLLSNGGKHLGLVAVVLLGVAVGAVDHDVDPALADLLLNGSNRLRVVVSTTGAASENDEAVLVAPGGGDGEDTLLGDTHEVVRAAGRLHGVDGNTDVTVSAVLETNGETQTTAELTVELGLGGSGTNGTQTEQVSQVLGRNGVEHLSSDGHTGVGEVRVELTSNTETLVDVESVVHIRVVDESLPANGGTGLLEVGTHDNNKVALELITKSLQLLGVLNSGGRVVDGAGAHNDEKLVALAIDDLNCLLTAQRNSLKGLLRSRNLALEVGRGHKGVVAQDTHILTVDLLVEAGDTVRAEHGRGGSLFSLLLFDIVNWGSTSHFSQ